MYKVIKRFLDLHTQKCYAVGDIFPHDGVSAERIEELTTENNRMRTPLIEKVEETEEKTKRTRKKKTEE